MSWIDKAERKFGKFAIPRIIRPIAGFQILVYVLILTTGSEFAFNLILDPAAILQGEVWRLVTFLFLPATMSPLWFLISVMFMLFVSESLENMWGAFRMNLYVFSGMFFLALGAFLLLLSVGPGNSVMASAYANSQALQFSLFLAFAVLFPDYEILAMMIIPIKAKWLGLIAAGLVFFRYIDSPAIGRIIIILGLANFFAFALPRAITAYRLSSDIAARRRRFDEARLPEVETFHECKRCGKSEVDDKDLEFRVTAEGKEYCVPCLKIMRAEEGASEGANP